MLIFVIMVVVILLVLLVGALLAVAASRFDTVVQDTKQALEQQDKNKAYNPAMTLGHLINLKSDAADQLKEARVLAARQAAQLPRGGNVQIGRKGQEMIRTASTARKEDPLTAARIAVIHGWDAVRMGMPAGGIPAAPVAAPAAAALAAGEVELVPGRDYPYIEITDAMSPEEVRKARIANSKAKSAAVKAAKAAGGVAAPTVGPATARTAAAPATLPPALAGIEPPKLIEITDDMDPDAVRKARIANSKAKSAFSKALKAAGIDPKDVELDEKGQVVLPQGAASVSAAPAPATAAAAPVPAPAGGLDLAALGVTPPDLIVITDAMSPDDVRKARIANAKAKSAFSKALKAAGVDPKDVEIDDAGNVTLAGGAPAAAPAAPAPAPAPEPTTPATAPAAGGGVDLAALGIEKPEFIEIVDGMSESEIRQARIANAKAKSAFNKALKAAGIDPQDVEL
jgi:hypothetical protein